MDTTFTCGTPPLLVLWGGEWARAVRCEGNFGGKKGLTCKIRHLGGQNGKTQHGPKVTSSSTRSSWRSPPRPRPSGRCPPRRAVIFDDILDSHGIQLTPPVHPRGAAAVTATAQCRAAHNSPDRARIVPFEQPVRHSHAHAHMQHLKPHKPNELL